MYSEEKIELRDIDECIKERKELIEEVKQLEEVTSSNEILRKINILKKKWKKIPYWESAYEDELSAEFDSFIEKYYAKKNEAAKESEETKKEIIKKAKALTESNEKNVNAKMNDLMKEWKAAGNSKDRETDDSLWNEFSEARKAFFEKRHQDWEELQLKFKDAKEAKEQLIEEAKKIAEEEDILKANDKMNALFEAWKSTPRASREEDDELWSRFNEARQVFYDKRNKFYDELHAKQAENHTKKAALVEEARTILETNEITRENTARMKELSVKWKEIGSCGKRKDDQVWKQFRGIMDEYFGSLKENNEKRQAEWQDRMNEVKNRKNDLILKTKRNIDRLEREMGETLSESMIADYKAEIEEKHKFIAELEKDIADIETKLNK